MTETGTWALYSRVDLEDGQRRLKPSVARLLPRHSAAVRKEGTGIKL